MTTKYRTEADVAETAKLLCKLTDRQYNYICILIFKFLRINGKREEQD